MAKDEQHEDRDQQEGTVMCLPPEEARELLLRREAPAGMRVCGDLDLAYCFGLTRIPDGFSVGGLLSLEGCSAVTSLGDGLSVDGDLNLWGCSALARVGEGLKVGGNLTLWGCSDLASLSHDLCVGGDLRLWDCYRLTSLGGGLSVGGDLQLRRSLRLVNLGDDLSVGGVLNLQGCSALACLPGGLSVGGYLDLGQCSALQERQRGDMGAFFEQLSAVLGPEAGLSLEGWDAIEQVPDGFSVGGDLVLGDCLALTSLPNGLSVGGDLILQDCSALTSLGDGLSVGGHLELYGCSALTRLHNGLSFAGRLDLSLCSALTSLGDGLRFAESLDLSRCSALTSLGDGLSFAGNLNLRDCSALTSLGDGLSVGGALNLRNCSALTSLGDGLSVGGALNLQGCSVLTCLPDNFSVDGYLDLSFCSALEERYRGNMGAFFKQLSGALGPKAGLSLEAWWRAVEQVPDGFGVGGTLNFRYCVALTSLPRGLHVGGDLILDSCLTLTSLPVDLFVGGDLHLEQCAAMESLPASILDWPARTPTDGSNDAPEPLPHNIFIGRSGLSSETLEWLRTADAPGLRFQVSLEDDWDNSDDGDEEAGRREGFENAAVAASFWAREAGLPIGVEQEMEGLGSVPEDATLVHFLSRLRSAKEFGIAETRKALAKRVVAVLELLSGDEERREELLLRMSDSLDACGDKPVWALNQMHLVVEIAKARGNAERLRDLGRRVMRLMVVHEHAKRKVDSLSFVDDVCVHLRFEIDLLEALDLPVDATAMIFPSYIKIEDAELEAAKRDALAITDDQFEAWLAAWPEWQRQQRREMASQVEWEGLPKVRRRMSLNKRVSRRLSQLLNVTGDKMFDPVSLDGGKSVWGLGDLLQHWERTGLDLHNSVVSLQQLQDDLRRVL